MRGLQLEQEVLQIEGTASNHAGLANLRRGSQRAVNALKRGPAESQKVSCQRGPARRAGRLRFSFGAGRGAHAFTLAVETRCTSGRPPQLAA